jgi:2-dehydro-3-deoxygalactonokinase
VKIKAEWVAVDWGTSNLRAWALDGSGAVVASRSSPQGMGKLEPGQYPAALTELLDDIEPSSGPSLEVLICGMAGARQGWLEAPYLEAPTDLRALVGGAVRPQMPNGRIVPAILPGVCQKGASFDNVMRGEETQLLGLSTLDPEFSGVVCMPGTHSKWATLSRSRIERFSTAMTGELYEVLRTHSVLRHSLTGDLDGPGRAEGFEAGSDAGLARPDNLLGQLFQVRAGSLLSGRQPDFSAGYLSGLLIGTEIGANRGWIAQNEVPLIGSPALCALYAQILGKIGISSRLVDATDAVLAGLSSARAFAL